MAQIELDTQKIYKMAKTGDYANALIYVLDQIYEYEKDLDDMEERHELNSNK